MGIFFSGYDDIFFDLKKKESRFARLSSGEKALPLLARWSWQVAVESPAAEPLVRNGARLDGRCFTSGTLCLLHALHELFQLSFRGEGVR